LIDNKNSNEITLLSFGGFFKHTLVMKYVSVWSNNNDNDNEINKSKKSNNYNEWVPFTDNHNHPIQIGRDKDKYEGVRAVIGGSDNNLLFITYYPNNISVFDLNTFQFIQHDTLLTYNPTWYHCFVSKSENKQEMKTNRKKNKIKKKNEMILFCKKAILSIEYDEDNNTLQSYSLRYYKNVTSFHRCAYVCINDVVLLFGGLSGGLGGKYIVSRAVHKYLIRENMWMKSEFTLPISLCDCFGVLSEDNTCIHIIGGNHYENKPVSTHIKANVITWCDVSQLIYCFFESNTNKLYLTNNRQSTNEMILIIQHWVKIAKIKLGWINEFNEIIIKYVKEYFLFKMITIYNLHFQIGKRF
ncbi:hypothetical protein RFI_34433, partial [Reticulomyxa filosa]